MSILGAILLSPLVLTAGLLSVAIVVGTVKYTIETIKGGKNK